MNISCEISSTHESNPSSFSACNITVADNGLKMDLMLHIMTFLLSFPINSYVIWLIVRGAGNGLAAEIFILNISVCEILLCLETPLASLSYTFENVSDAMNFLDGLTITGRPLFQCLMCVERYLAVIHPVTFLKFKPLRYRLMCSAVSWVTSFGYCIFNFVTLLFSFHYLYIICYVSQFFIFFSIQLFCCVAVLRALKQSGPGERGREREEENNMKRRAFFVILITSVSMVILNIPQIILLLEWESSEHADILTPFNNVCFLFAGLVQPLLFLFRVRKLPFITSK